MGARKRPPSDLLTIIGATGSVQGANQTLTETPRQVDQRLTSFLERYLIERAGQCKGEDPLQEAWLVIQDGRKIYEMIQVAGSKGSS